jgi:Uma2 family endonuclease
MAPSGPEHVRAGEPIRDAFVAYKLAHRDRVSQVVSEAWIAVDENSHRIADLAVYLKNLRSNVDIPELVPDIVLEVVSGGGEDRKRDYVDKRAEYLRIGVKEYVILDRFQRRLTVLRRVRGRFVESHLGADDVFTSTLLPGLNIPLNGIL